MRQIVEITGVGEVLAAACADKGFRSVEDIAAAKVADLVAVPGVSIIRANQLIQAAQGLLHNASQPDAARAGDDAVISSADTHHQDGNASPPAPRITNGAGDQADSTQTADKVSALSQTAASSTSTTAILEPVAPAKAEKQKKQKLKASKKKRQNKKCTDKKTNKKNKKTKSKNDKKSAKNKNKKNSKKDKSRRKKKSGKSK